MKALKSCLCFALLISATGVAVADDANVAIEGSYLLIQEDKYQRVLSLGSGGVALHAASEETVVGFTGGQGAWAQTGTGSANAKVVDFTYTLGDGKPIGPTVTRYELTFSDEESGQYQKVEGVFTGAQHAAGQNPLTTKEQPLRTFQVRFTGQRITAD